MTAFLAKSSFNFRRRNGFSLVEVVLALGLVTFCLVAILGLLPVGLNTVHEANQEAEASRLLKQMATGIQGAALQPDGSYRMLGLGSLTNTTWTPDGGSLAPLSGMMKASGMPTSSTDDAAYAYRVEIEPPADVWSSGRAVIRIAWPAAAQWTSSGWTPAQGSVKALVLFRAQ